MNCLKCECGHENPFGTEICEACGKPANEQTGQKLLNMRYEGVARRSQTYQKNIVDKIWNFFSSVRVGIWLIVITLIASAIGTILPQEMYIPPNISPSQFYKDEYGMFGYIFFVLGFHNLFGSWWYMLLLASMGLSLIIASWDRVVPLYRSLKKQRVTRHVGFLKRQRIFGEARVQNKTETINLVQQQLKQKRYRVRKENGNILAEKGRFSRWGPYVNHLGLIIVLIGAMLRFFPDMYVDEILWVRDGETEAIPGTERKYYLKNEKFTLETYTEDDEIYKEMIETVGNGIVKKYQTDAILYENINREVAGAEPELVKMKEEEIIVNYPLKFEGFALYQTSYKLNEFYKMRFKLEEKSTGKTFGEIEVDLFNPKSTYLLSDGYRVELMSFFPDFEFTKEGPTTKSKIPNNPAFLFKMYTPETEEGEVSFITIQNNTEPLGENKYKMSFSGLDVRNITALTVRKDHTLGIIALGGLIFMIGLVQGMYWNHRRIWIQQSNKEILVAAHTNKNWYGLKKDIEYILEDTNIPIPKDQTE